MATQKHIHKYHKINGLWHCGLDDCTHFMPHNVTGAVRGKRSLCWECGKEIVLNDINMSDRQPVCLSCRKEVEDIENIAKALDLDNPFSPFNKKLAGIGKKNE